HDAGIANDRDAIAVGGVELLIVQNVDLVHPQAILRPDRRDERFGVVAQATAGLAIQHDAGPFQVRGGIACLGCRVAHSTASGGAAPSSRSPASTSSTARSSSASW